MNRRLAVASACKSAVPDLRRANKGLSVSTAFLAAGYSGAIGMSWVVSDLSTTILMSRFYRLLKAQKGPIEDISRHLRAAQHWVRTSSESEIAEEFPWSRFVFGLSPGSISVRTPLRAPLPLGRACAVRDLTHSQSRGATRFTRINRHRSLRLPRRLGQ